MPENSAIKPGKGFILTIEILSTGNEALRRYQQYMLFHRGLKRGEKTVKPNLR